jgi:hypothetical protein
MCIVFVVIERIDLVCLVIPRGLVSRIDFRVLNVQALYFG